MKKLPQSDKKLRISLRIKAIAAIVLIYAILIFCFVYISIVMQHHHSEERIIEASRMKARLISAAIERDVSEKDELFLKGFTEHVLAESNIEYIQIVDHEGNRLAEGGLLRRFLEHREKNPELNEHLSEPAVHEIGHSEGMLHKSGHIFNIYVPVKFETRQVGGIHLGVNTMAANQYLAGLTYRWIIITVVITLAGILLTYLIFNKMRKALRQLIDATAHVAQGDMGQSTSIQTGDELEELSLSFNQMTRALVERERDLMIAKNTMVSMFNGITAGIAYISKDYHVIHANQAYESLLKNGVELLSNEKKCYEMFGQKEAVCKQCPGTLAMKTGESHHVEREVVLHDGGQHVLWVHAYPVLDPDKSLGGFVEYILDITEQRRMQNELERYAEHLEEMVEERTSRLQEAHLQMVHHEKMAALGQMAAGVAHEIGNPLSSMTSIVEALNDEAQLHKGCQERLGLMKEQVERITRIVRQMTEFSRPALSQKSLTHVNGVLRSALGISHYDERLKEVHIITSLDSEVPALKLNADQLLQVFLNIILNAGDAMKGKGTLTITSRCENGSIHVSFEDTGSGISESSLPHVFEPFFTTKDVGEGTGLGLSVSYGMMQRMGGEIRAASRPQGGSVFIVEIPMKGQ